MEAIAPYDNTSMAFSSPDVNLVESLWTLIKIKVTSRKVQTLKDLKRAIYKEWIDLPTKLVLNL